MQRRSMERFPSEERLSGGIRGCETNIAGNWRSALTSGRNASERQPCAAKERGEPMMT